MRKFELEKMRNSKALQAERMMNKYRIDVVTSGDRNAGTDANVKINIFGELGDSGPQPLKKKWKDLFWRFLKNEKVDRQ